MEARHMPGPWVIEQRTTVLIETDSGNLIACYAGSEANARLIAAAPDLLNAAEEALGALNGAEHALPGYVVAALERAIAKATS